MPNSFQVNCADAYKGLFPLNFGFDLHEGGIVDAFLCPQAVHEAADALARFAFPWLCVFGCSITFPEDRTLAETAAALDLDLHAIGPEVIVLPTADLGRLAERIDQYNLSAIDWDDLDLAAIRRAVEWLERDDHPEDRCRLADLPHSRVYLKSHDDCYLSVEWRDAQAVRAYLGRLLAEYAVALLSDGGGSPVSVAVSSGRRAGVDRGGGSLPHGPRRGHLPGALRSQDRVLPRNAVLPAPDQPRRVVDPHLRRRIGHLELGEGHGMNGVVAELTAVDLR